MLIALKKDITAVTLEDAVEYINHTLAAAYQTGRQTTSTFRQHYYSLTAFFDYYWAKKEYDVDAFHTRLNEPPKTPLPDPSHLPDASEMAILLQEAKKKSSFLYLYLLLAYECCLSVSEILSIRMDGFKIQDIPDEIERETTREIYVLVVLPMKRTQRTIELGKDLFSELQCYAKETSLEGEYLFSSRNKKQMSVRGLQSKLRNFEMDLLEKKQLRQVYSSQQIRTAGLHRYIQDRSDYYELAEYTKISAPYIYKLASTSSEQVVGLPTKKRRFGIKELLAEETTEQTSIDKEDKKSVD